MVSFCSFQISFPNTCTVLIFFIAGLLFLCLEHVEHWERIASRWRPAFSSHLISSIKEEVKKKDISIGWNFSCFSAHLSERELFCPSAACARLRGTLPMRFGLS